MNNNENFQNPETETNKFFHQHQSFETSPLLYNQKKFHQSILQRLLHQQAGSKVPHVESDLDLQKIIQPIPALNHQQVIDVYLEDYEVRLQEALAENFPALKILLGEAPFKQLALEYLTHYPSVSYNLSDLGEYLPAYLNTLLSSPLYTSTSTSTSTSPTDTSLKNFLPKNLPFISDLAAFEWAFVQVFHSYQHSSLHPRELERITQYENLKLHLAPSCRIFSSTFPIFHLWNVIQNQASIENIEYQDGIYQDEMNEISSDGIYHYLFYKFKSKVYIKSIKAEQKVILEELIHGATLGDALESLISWRENYLRKNHSEVEEKSSEESTNESTKESSKEFSESQGLQEIVFKLFQFMMSAEMIVSID